MPWLLGFGIAIALALASIGALGVAVIAGRFDPGQAPAFWGALVTGGAAVWVLAAGKLAELGIEVERRRRESREFMVALRAEITSDVKRLRQSSGERTRAETFKRYKQIEDAEIELKRKHPDLLLTSVAQGSAASARFGAVDSNNFVLMLYVIGYTHFRRK